MNRLFIRGLILILLAQFLSFVVASVIVHSAIVHRWKDAPPDFSRFASAIIEETTSDMSPAERSALIHRLQREKQLPIDIAPMTALGLSAENTARLARGETVIAGSSAQMSDRWHGDGLLVFVPVEDGARAMVIAPRIPTIPGWQTWVLVLLSVTAIVSIAAVLIARPIVRHLRPLEAATARIAAGDLTARTDVYSKDAIGSLARAFNTMAERIQKLLENQRHLVQAVAHELRTPIARMRFGLEMLGGSSPDAGLEDRRASLEADLAELDALAEELLVYSRYDSERARLEKVPLDPAAVVRDRFDAFHPVHPTLAMKLTSNLPSDALVNLDLRSLERVVGNLIGNAARYAQQTIEVRIEQDGGNLCVEVHDDGPGIPSGDRQRLLEPFVRLDDSRSRASGGAGLGLAIVQRILQANGGEVRIDESDLGGARIVTTWPLENGTLRANAM